MATGFECWLIGRLAKVGQQQARMGKCSEQRVVTTTET